MAKAIQTKQEVLQRVEAAKEQLEKISPPRVRGALHGFADFIREQGVVGLAIGFVLGTQSKVLVDQIVASFINPLLGLVLPGAGELTARTFSLTFNNKTQQFGWGAFLYQMIAFIIVAAVIYVVFRSLKLDKLDKKKG